MTTVEQRAVGLQQEHTLETATQALIDVAAELRAKRKADAARDERLDNLLAAQQRFLGMVEGHQQRLDTHEDRLDAHDGRHDGHDQAHAELAERVEQVEAARLAGWRLGLAVVALVLTGATIMLTGVLVGSAWARW